jgi:hypothetical protein
MLRVLSEVDGQERRRGGGVVVEAASPSLSVSNIKERLRCKNL